MPLELLLVEDNPAEARLLKEIVEGSPLALNITTAKNCSEALEILDEGRVAPNLVIADMGVLEFNGVELMKRCKPREISVVIFSGSVSPADQARAMTLGANEFVTKPIQLDDYVEAVRKIIGKWAGLDSAAAGRNDYHSSGRSTPVEVLLIEDNEGDWRLIQRITSQSTVPVRTTVVPTCASALAILAEGSFVPNLIITDMSVPGAGASEMLRRCAAMDIPVVVFSGSVNADYRAEALRLGVKEIVAKPYTIDEFTTAVWALIWKWTARGAS